MIILQLRLLLAQHPVRVERVNPGSLNSLLDIHLSIGNLLDTDWAGSGGWTAVQSPNANGLFSRDRTVHPLDWPTTGWAELPVGLESQMSLTPPTSPQLSYPRLRCTADILKS